MSVDENTAAAIFEIDRTLRSLGIRDDYSAPPLPAPPASTCSLDATREPVSRRNAAAQSTGPSSVSAGVQTCVHSVQRGVQHGPRVHTAATQTVPREEVPPCLLSILQTAEAASMLVEEHTKNLARASSTVSVLTERVHVLEKSTRRVAAQLTTSRSEMAVLTVEKAEQLARSDVVAEEHSARLALAAMRVEELLLRATALERVRPACGLEKQVNSAIPKLRKKSPVLGGDTPDSSLNGLTDLLDECWRVLEE